MTKRQRWAVSGAALGAAAGIYGELSHTPLKEWLDSWLYVGAAVANFTEIAVAAGLACAIGYAADGFARRP